MKIKEIRAVQVDLPERRHPGVPPASPVYTGAGARRDAWARDAEVANPMSVYPAYKRHRSLWLPKWGGVWVQAVAEDGTFGLGQTSFGRPVAAIVDDHFGPMLKGESCFAIEKCWDMMFRMSKPYGSTGLAACAMSGVDLALWDLAGKLRGKPVYELLGGPVRDRIFCYATGNDTDWQLELGFRAVKLACPYGPADGTKGLDENERLVAKTRELVGDDVEVMLDCYMAFDVAYTIRLARRLEAYGLRWIEEYLIPEDIDGHRAVREAVDWVGLASGEHLYTRWPFMQLIRAGALDILQPDIKWVGGLSECVKIAHMASAAGLTVIPHAGGNSPYGQHFAYATPNAPWAECFVASAPGVPMQEAAGPGQAVPVEGWLVPGDAPGFGIEVPEGAIRPFQY